MDELNPQAPASTDAVEQPAAPAVDVQAVAESAPAEQTPPAVDVQTDMSAEQQTPPAVTEQPDAKPSTVEVPAAYHVAAVSEFEKLLEEIEALPAHLAARVRAIGSLLGFYPKD